MSRPSGSASGPGNPRYSYTAASPPAPAAAAADDEDVLDPYPEDDDTPSIFDAGAATAGSGGAQQYEYDESEMQEQGDEEYTPVAAHEYEQQAGEEDFSYQPAPQQQQRQQQQPQQQRQQQRQQPAQRQPQRGQPMRTAAQPAAAARRPAQPPRAAPVVEEDPFADPDAVMYAAPAAAKPAPKRRPAAAAAPAPKATRPTGAASSAAAAPRSAAAAASAPAAAAAAPASSASSTAPMAQSALAGKMESMLRHNMAALESGGERVLNSIRGIDAPGTEARATVDDEQLASHNYDLWEDHVNSMALDGSASKTANELHGHVLTFLQLLLTVAVAFFTALAMFLISRLVESCSEWRMETTLELIGDERPYEAYFALLAMSLTLALIATCLVVFLAPHAKGGGVPYVQAYLNGTNVSSYFSTRIVLVKIGALGFTIASGLTLGMEGPFVFIGSGIAIILNKSLELLSLGQRVGGKYARILKNINEERVFMAGGMAAGLAVAFNAPIAGVLMALEGSTAFLTVPVVLRIFGCAMFATFFNDVAHANFGPNIKTHNLIMITAPAHGAPDEPEYAWVLWEIVAFAFIAIVGGTLGALAIWVNVKVTKWRHHHVEPSPANGNKLNIPFAIREVLAVMFVTATVFFVLPYVFGCREMHEQCFPTIAVPHKCTAAQCPSSFYSEIGTIIYSSADTVARILFDRTLLPVNDMSPGPLLVYAGFYMTFVAVVYGAHVPGGLFVPSVVVGGCVGRAFGSFLHMYVSAAINPGVYALLGAASMFGGFTRLVLPAAVMLIEMTGDSTYLLPIMFCTCLAKIVSDEMQPPLYPQHMAIEGIPTLGDKLNPLIAPLRAKHIMQRNFHAVRQLDSLGHILEVLDNSRSMLLPVVTPDGSDKFVGMVMRRSVLYALKYTKLYKDHAEFMAENSADQAEASGAAGMGTATVMGGAGPQQRRANSSMLEVEKKMGDVRNTNTAAADTLEKFDDKFATYLVNITPFMDAGALTAHEETSAKRIAAIFRRLGISHLGVSDGNNKLVGIITRRHLIKPPAVAPAGSADNPADAVAQLMEKEQLDASPETVLELAQYDPSLALEAEAMGPFGANQARAANSRRTASLLGGNDPFVRFDDDEDDAAVDEPVDEEDENEGGQGGVADAQLYDEGDDGEGDLMRTGSSTTSSNGHIAIGVTPRRHSSLSRLNSYTKQL